MQWTNYDGKVVTELPKDCFGFVYKITYKDGTYYYGKKQVVFKKTLPMLKNGERRPNSKVVTKRVPLTAEERKAKKPSDKRLSKLVQFEEVSAITPSWKKYTGSSQDTPPDSQILSKVILLLSKDKRTLTYLETYILMKDHSVVKSNCHNKNILGKFYDNALEGWIKDW